MQMRHFQLLQVGGLFLLLIFLQSCAVSSTVSAGATYQNESFSPRELDRAGFAILPVTAGADLEGYRRPFGDKLNWVATGIFKNVIPWDSTMQILNKAGMVQDYQQLIKTYNETAILDQSVTKKLTETLGVAYLLYVKLGAPEQSQDVGYNYLTGGVSTTQTRAVSAYAKIWQSDGDVAWEGSSTAKAVAGNYSYIAENYQQQAEKAAEALIRAIAGVFETNP